MIRALTGGITRKGESATGSVPNILGQRDGVTARCETPFAVETDPGQVVAVPVDPTQGEGAPMRMPRGVPHGRFDTSRRPCRAPFRVAPARGLKELPDMTGPETAVGVSTAQDVGARPPEAND